MAIQVWQAEGGAVFLNKEDAERHEFEQELLVCVNGNTSRDAVFRLLEKYTIERKQPPTPAFNVPGYSRSNDGIITRNHDGKIMYSERFGVTLEPIYDQPSDT